MAKNIRVCKKPSKYNSSTFNHNLVSSSQKLAVVIHLAVKTSSFVRLNSTPDVCTIQSDQNTFLDPDQFKFT